MSSRFAYRVAGGLDVAAMNQACQTLVGKHDFASFASDVSAELEKSTIREVYRAKVVRDGDNVVLI